MIEKEVARSKSSRSLFLLGAIIISNTSPFLLSKEEGTVMQSWISDGVKHPNVCFFLKESLHLSTTF